MVAAVPQSAQAFSADARKYDALRRGLVPCFESFYGEIGLLMMDWGGPEAPRVLDLGAGTGLVASFVLATRPRARLTLMDGSDAMLDVARGRFSLVPDVHYVLADFSSADLGGDWDLIVSGLAIHHLEHEDKQALFARIAAALAPGGLFINAEQILGPTATLEARNERIWAAQAAALGVPEAEIYNARQRMLHDRCAPVEDQLNWMRVAGLADVDCSFKSHRFAVMSGRRP